MLLILVLVRLSYTVDREEAEHKRHIVWGVSAWELTDLRIKNDQYYNVTL